MQTHPHSPTPRSIRAVIRGHELSWHLERLLGRLALGRSLDAIPIRISTEDIELDLRCGRAD